MRQSTPETEAAIMCNAYSLTHPREEMIAYAEDLARHFDGCDAEFAEQLPDFKIRYRISPRQTAPILMLDHIGKPAYRTALWGFSVRGGKPGFAPTNARDDKLVHGWPWKMISSTQRCLVLSDGFFEPEKPAGAKGTVPWSYYAMGNRQLFAMAGLYNEGPHPKTGEPVMSFTVVTTSANETIIKHDRMPAILDGDAQLRWLKRGAVPEDDLEPYPAHKMMAHRVIDEARNSRIPDHAGMIEPVRDTPDLFS